MGEDVERRKSELLASLQEKYADKPKKWWHGGIPVYTSTKVLAAKCKKIDHNATEVIIRTKILYGIVIVIFFLIGVLVQIVPLPKHIKVISNPITLIAFSIGFIYYTARVINRKPRIIVNTNGIRINKINKLIPWENIVAAFIKWLGSGRPFYYLIVHYFDPETGQFKETEYRIDELDITNEELSFYIEKFLDRDKMA